MAIKNSSQKWQQGEVVKIGFITGLEVIRCIPTPNDYSPDAYALWQPTTGRFYQFVPHKGLHRCWDLANALRVES